MTDPDLSASDVARAREFAIAAHADQRYGDQPYFVHLDAVASALTQYGHRAQIVAYLHDTVEDTTITRDQVAKEFGEFVARCVELVTDEQGENRGARKEKTNAKLAKVTGELELALIVKAADRLANLRASQASPGNEKLDMYRREHPAFKSAAYRPGLCDELWLEMDRILSA